jgi:hypothetical protein
VCKHNDRPTANGRQKWPRAIKSKNPIAQMAMRSLETFKAISYFGQVNYYLGDEVRKYHSPNGDELKILVLHTGTYPT